MTRPGVGILVAIVIFGLSITAFALSRTLWLSLAFLAISGAADSVSVSQRHTLRNLLTPDRLRGRVAAAHSTFAAGGPQLGDVKAGIVASWIGAPLAVAIGGWLPRSPRWSLHGKCRESPAFVGSVTAPPSRSRMLRKSVVKGSNVLTKEAPGRYDATECPGQPFLWLSVRESARTRALSGGSPPGRVVLGALDFLGQALGVGRDG